MNPNISNNNCPTCPACSHPPHLGACSRRMGGTAYSCGCLRQTPTPPARDDDATRIVPPCPGCVSERGAVDPNCRTCGGTGQCPSADDASGAEAMRAEFLAWVNAGYLVRDAVTPVEWDDEGLPVYYTRDDGVRHYLDGEWHAWQAARALPLPARDDAVEEAMPTRGDVGRREATRDPVFLLQVRDKGRRPEADRWRTDGVWFTREEAEAFAAAHVHRWPDDRYGKRWHVYCVPADGDLARLLKAVTKRDAALRAKGGA